MLSYITCFVVLCLLRYRTSNVCYVITCYFMLCDITCYLMFYSMSCYVMLYNMLFYVTFYTMLCLL